MDVRVRLTNGNHVIGEASRFNTASLDEVIVYFDDGADSVSMKKLDVKLRNGAWVDILDAFRDKEIIPDNFSTSFSYAETEEDKIRGYSL